jgi:cell division septum initiation protein DivIVA
MLMTETELNNLFGQVNVAFKEQSDRLKELKQQLDQLEERLDGYEKRSKTGTRGRKRVQQTEANPESSDQEVRSGGEGGGQDQDH